MLWPVGNVGAGLAVLALAATGVGQTPIAAETRQLVERLRAFAARAGQPDPDAWTEAACGTVGRSRLCWLEGESGVLVFGRSGGLLLRVRGRYPVDVETRDFDRDGRPELTLVIRSWGGTGTLAHERHIYFFDGQRFAPAMRVISSSYTDSTWFGMIKRDKESFEVPMLSSDGELRFRDVDGDGHADVAEAIERRWWGELLDNAERRLESGPAWASRILRARFGLGLGVVLERVVRRWTRSRTQPIFVAIGEKSGAPVISFGLYPAFSDAFTLATREKGARVQ